ncbi:hypothetical protein N6393_004212 [Vibrio vulnificus]|nr:hypothetical protein [Vibrio vulnificus]
MVLKKVLLAIFIIVPNIAQAALVCTGSAYGLQNTYTFKKTSSKDLALHIQVKMGSESVVDTKGVAKYTSTVQLRELELESYYYFTHGKNSYTELISIDNNLKAMGRSRPTSSSANYVELTCRGNI